METIIHKRQWSYLGYMVKKILLKLYKKTIYKIISRNQSPLVECQRRYGNKNRSETIYIIRRPSKTVGLLSYVITTLGHIQRAVDQGYKVVVDMKNYENMYQQSKKDNSWEYFFEQPSRISLDEAYKSQNVILTSETIPETRPNDTDDFYYNMYNRKCWQELCKKYIRVNSDVNQYVEEIKDRLFGCSEGQKVLGVLCRGTDYTSLKPKSHPVQPTAKQLIQRIHELKKIYCIDKIFLVTEDEHVLEEFKQEFTEGILKYLDTKRFTGHEKEYLVNTMYREQVNTKRQGIDYLAQILLLSKCEYFIGGRTSGSVGVALFSDGFEYEEYFDLGRY